jgi:hypothetical protein
MINVCMGSGILITLYFLGKKYIARGLKTMTEEERQYAKG